MRPKLTVSLLGRFAVRFDDRPLLDRVPRKVQELFAYLLLHGDRPHPREYLASALWGESQGDSSLKYLRQALWQLRLGLNGAGGYPIGGLLQVEPRWLQFIGAERVAVDVFEFERAVGQARGPRAQTPDPAAFTRLKAAEALYGGDLLEGWYADWCAPRRERLARNYLSVLEDLAENCAACGEYEAGIGYAQTALDRDPVREPSYRVLMRLLHLSGDRIGALRAYEHCVRVLRAELGIGPEERTVRLASEIRGDCGTGAAPGPLQRSGRAR